MELFSQSKTKTVLGIAEVTIATSNTAWHWREVNAHATVASRVSGWWKDGRKLWEERSLVGRGAFDSHIDRVDEVRYGLDL
jgi:hypothetical protein